MLRGRRFNRKEVTKIIFHREREKTRKLGVGRGKSTEIIHIYKLYQSNKTKFIIMRIRSTKLAQCSGS